MNKATQDKIRALAESGASVMQICRETDLSMSTVRYRLRKLNIRAGPPTWQRTELDRWKKHVRVINRGLKDRKTWTQIAEDCAGIDGASERDIRARMSFEAFLRLLHASMETGESFSAFASVAINERLERLEAERQRNQPVKPDRRRKRTDAAEAENRNAETGELGDQGAARERSSGSEDRNCSSIAAINQETESVRTITGA